MPVMAGHTSAVLDFDFYPFDESLIASCSDDCTIKVTGLDAAPFVFQFLRWCPCARLSANNSGLGRTALGRVLVLSRIQSSGSRAFCVCSHLPPPRPMQGWGIPDGGLTETITEPLFTMNGHQRKVTLILWHPTATNILAR
ncbi:unnamed protein product [Phaeothamnion confervicola]